jgi:adenylate cyclase
MTERGLRSLDLAAFQRWLVDVPHVDDGGPAFMGALVERLASLGLPLWRVSYALMTMHPEVLWRTVQWHEAQGVTVLDREHTRLTEAFYRESPIAVAREGAAPVRVPLGEGALPFKTCDDLRAQGGTDYYAHGLPFANGQMSYISYATRAPEGFSAEALAALEAIRPFLARRLELESSYYGTRALLDVYLGKNAARRVLAGAFQRGKGELIDAAVWFSDMRDFTALSDRSAPAEVVETLDAYFDAVASAVAAGGGEVLKFIGDAVLAIFPVGDDPRAACRRALAAAEEAFASLERLNDARAARAQSTLAIGIALHRGQVMYGNIGARDRLDFTVISSCVNEASRLEALCKRLGTPLALSEPFVNAAEATGVVDLGAHELKGVKAPLRVFTLSRLQPR